MGGTATRVPPPRAVQVEEVCKRYGEVTAVDGVTIDVACGTIVAVLGPNGAGTTTLVEMLAGFVTPSSGRIRVLGEDPRRPSRRWRSRVGMVSQATALDPQLTVGEVLAAVAGPFPDPLPASEALSLAGLTGQAQTRIQALSGGQQRRADLAAAVIGRPSLLEEARSRAPGPVPASQGVVCHDLGGGGHCYITCRHRNGGLIDSKRRGDSRRCGRRRCGRHRRLTADDGQTRCPQ